MDSHPWQRTSNPQCCTTRGHVCHSHQNHWRTHRFPTCMRRITSSLYSSNKPKSCSTYCAAQESTHSYQPKPSSTVLSISTQHPSDYQESEPSSMNYPTSAAHGHLMQYLDFAPVSPPSTTTVTKYGSSRPATNASPALYSGSQPKSRYHEDHQPTLPQQQPKI